MTNNDRILERFLISQDSLVLQASDLSLGTIAGMVSKGAIDINPPFQRRERWTVKKRSALIESFLLNVPVPPIYLAEDEFGKYSVVDGKQRITSIDQFINEKLNLTGLETFTTINGMKFSDLPADMQNALNIRPYLRVVTLLKQSDPNLKFEVFTRLNLGGDTMEPQELRNVAFRGPLNEVIYQLSDNPFLRQQLKIKSEKSRAYQTMLDAEYVLRFLMLRESWEHFSGDYRAEMDSFMREYQFASENELEQFQSAFDEAISGCNKIWGNHAFKRPFNEGWRDQLLAGLYDAEMIAVSLLSPDMRKRAEKRNERIKDETRDLFLDKAFDEAARVGTNTPSRVVYRIKRVHRLLEEVAR